LLSLDFRFGYSEYNQSFQMDDDDIQFEAKGAIACKAVVFQAKISGMSGDNSFSVCCFIANPCSEFPPSLSYSGMRIWEQT